MHLAVLGHGAVGYYCLLNGVELNHLTADFREHPQSACRRRSAQANGT